MGNRLRGYLLMRRFFLVEVIENEDTFNPRTTYNIEATSKEAAEAIALEWAEMEGIENPSLEVSEYFPESD